jgi:glutamate dehydrogenase/leucine dehydrogenase
VTGGYHNKDGIDVLAALAHVAKTDHRTLEGFAADRVSNEELLELPCDILVPAALENQLTEKNARKIKAHLIAEGANGPTTAEADRLLSEGGVTIIPDILANAGGVTVSYFEWVQNRMGYYWRENEVNERLRELLRENFDVVWDTSKQFDTTLRGGAYTVAIKRVVDAYTTRGIYA